MSQYYQTGIWSYKDVLVTNYDVEEGAERGEGDDNVCDRGIDQPQATGEKKKGNLKHDGESLYG